MLSRPLGPAAAVAAALLSAGPAEAAFIYEEGLATGVRITQRGELRDGLEITNPVAAYVRNKEYGYQVAPLGEYTKNESFVARDPADRTRNFASAVADSDGVLEVGVDNSNFISGSHVAVARSRFFIDNGTDTPISFNTFFYSIPEAEFGIVDFSQRFERVDIQMEVLLDYVLETPPTDSDGNPIGGPREVTGGNLLSYAIELETDGSVRSRVARHELLPPTTPSERRYRAAAVEGLVPLPEIPAFGRLYLYYDMYAFTVVTPNEVFAYAQIGDPNDLTAEGGSELILGGAPAAVPEPASAGLLLGGGLLAAGVIRRRRVL
jgi:hypothetical protein